MNPGQFSSDDNNQRPDGSKVPHQRPDGSPHSPTPHWPLAGDLSPHIGNAIAAIVAETTEQARNAAELLDIDYEPLPAVTDALAALDPGAPKVWPDLPDNLCFQKELGDRERCDDASAARASL